MGYTLEIVVFVNRKRRKKIIKVTGRLITIFNIIATNWKNNLDANDYIEILLCFVSTFTFDCVETSRFIYRIVLEKFIR